MGERERGRESGGGVRERRGMEDCIKKSNREMKGKRKRRQKVLKDRERERERERVRERERERERWEVKERKGIKDSIKGKSNREIKGKRKKEKELCLNDRK